MQKNCYFASRNEIIHWINSVLDVNITSIQQLGAGNIYCHLLDAAFPGKVPLQKVKWKAYLEVDFIYNFKILQSCFDHLGIDKYIEVEKLVKAKCQDNLQFSQWLMGQLGDRIRDNKSYDSARRRSYADVMIGETGGIKRTKSFTQITINSQTNKQNARNQNKAGIPGNMLFARKASLGQIGPLTPRQRNNNRSFDSKKMFKTPSFLQKKSQKITQFSKQKYSKRIRTQSSQLLICDITKQLILQEDEECF